MQKINNLTNQRFGNLVALEPTNIRASDGCIQWRCKCDCGNFVNVSSSNLKRGNTKSCGCYKIKRIRDSHKKYNEIIEHEKYIEVLTKGNKSFIIDKDDYDKIKGICWNVGNDGRVSGKCNGKMTRVHRLIMNAKENELIDHINNDPSDNRKSNLRFANKSQNGINRRANNNNKLGIKGVNQIRNGKYVSKITVNYKTIYIGCFENLDDAIKARKEAERKYFGEYAYKGD